MEGWRVQWRGGTAEGLAGEAGVAAHGDREEGKADRLRMGWRHRGEQLARVRACSWDGGPEVEGGRAGVGGDGPAAA
jgi:hypothetical protein